MTLYQALSLRRSMLRSFPGGMRRVGTSPSMGSQQGQQDISRLFEDALFGFVRNSIAKGRADVFYTEAELLAEMKSGKQPRGPTPDILFREPVKINGQLVKWMDAKLFYGSAKYATNTKIPNGKLQNVAKRYNDHFGGKGAFVFGRGFCADLADYVPGALLLDATPLNMSAVDEFQDAS